MTTGFSWAVAVAAAIVVSTVPGPTAGHAGTCQRAVSIAPQASAGEGLGRLTFSVLSSGCAAAGEVGYAVTAGTAQPGVDFRLPSGLLRWAAGDEGIRTITATLVADVEREADLEDFTVRLIEPSPDVQIVRQAAQGRILDDDGPLPIIAVTDGICQEWGGKPNCDVDFDLSAALPDPMTVHWATVDGTARAGVDYLGVADAILTLPAGETAATLRVHVMLRPKGTPSSWFYVHIRSVSAGRIADSIAVVTIDRS